MTADVAVAPSAGRSLLGVRDLSIRFGGIAALSGLTFDVEPKTVCGLIGPNGAGKTTVFNCISRLYPPTGGTIWFDGTLLSRLPARKVAGAGIGRTFQNLALFKSMSVRDTVMAGAPAALRSGFLATALGLPRVDRRERELTRRAADLIAFVGLAGHEDRKVADLPFGFQKRVELARALAGDPKLILLDEPAAGLNHDEIENLFGLIRALCDSRGIAVLIVEHHMNLIMRVSDKVVALNFGQKIADGSPRAVQENPAVIQAYLGRPA